jgi:hypothetical protein
MNEAQKIADWLFANKDKEGTPEFNEKLNQFSQVYSPPKAEPIKVPPRGEDTVRILQKEYITEYERVPKDAEDKARKEGNLAALTRELANLKAQPPAVEEKQPVDQTGQPATQAAPEDESLAKLQKDMAAIDTKQKERQPEEMRTNAQLLGAAIGAVPGGIQQAMLMKDAAGRGVKGGMGYFADMVAQRMQPPGGMSTVADLANDVIGGELPQGVTPSTVNQTATRFYQQFPNELQNGNMAAGGRGTYAYARSFQLPIELSMQAVDLKDAQRLVQERRAGTLAAQAAFPSETLVERPTSGVLTLGERREPRARLIIGGEQEPPPPPPPQQPRSALPPAAPLTGAPQPRLTAGTNPFQPGRAALLQGSPAEAPMPPMTAGTPPPGAAPGVRVEPTLGQGVLPAPAATSAARGPVRSGLDAVTGMFARNVAEPAQRALSALPIIPKTLGGMQIGGGGAEALTGARQGDVGKIGTGAAEMLGGGLSMFGRTAPAGMTISILTELYRNARTPEDRQKIMDTLNKMMFGEQQTM